MGKAEVKDRTMNKSRAWYVVTLRQIHHDTGRELAKFKAKGDAYMWACEIASRWTLDYVLEIR